MADDFRATRRKLPPEAFVFSSGDPDPSPTNLLDQPTWDHLVHLTDHVSLWTSDHHGDQLHGAQWGHGAFVSLAVAIQRMDEDQEGDTQASPITEALMFVTDDLAVSIHLVLTGFYAQSLRSLRVVLEAMMRGAYFRATGDQSAFRQWLEGGDDESVRPAAIRVGLAKHEPYITVNSADELFVSGKRGSWLGQLYHTLSAFIHARPYSEQDGQAVPTSNATLWTSNGPIYVAAVVDRWYEVYLETCLATLCLLGLAEPRIIEAPAAFRDEPTFSEIMTELREAQADHLHPGARRVIEYLDPDS